MSTSPLHPVVITTAHDDIGLGGTNHGNRRRAGVYPWADPDLSSVTSRRRILLTVLVILVTLLIAASLDGLLTVFPTSLLLPLLMMVVATVLFYVWT